jgi:cyclopropane-fatty-acyl-phospholipid synthase
MWLLERVLRRAIRRGELVVVDHRGVAHAFGAPDAELGRIVIRFTDRRVPYDIVRSPALGAGEAIMDARLVVEEGDIMALLNLMRANERWEDRAPGQRRRIGGSGKSALRRLRNLNWERRSRRNVAHHYDLSDRLYDLFLDADRQYSCAFFTDPANSLEQAQADKKAHIAAKLHLGPGQRVLDIGCGWGGMALYLNRVAGVDVLGITLSEEQLKVARRRAEEAGVADRVKIELIDYRRIDGRFDRIVSVGMFEHVGVPHYRAFFRKCRSLLTDDGVMLLHTIGRMGGPGTTDRFTTKYIFPGGYNPALSEIVAASEAERMIAADVETLRYHYAYTLAHWYQRVAEKKAEIVALYDERFFRMWQIYLAGAYVAFRHGGMVNYQIQYLRSRDAVPIIRDHMFEDEQRLRAGGA